MQIDNDGRGQESGWAIKSFFRVLPILSLMQYVIHTIALLSTNIKGT